MGMKLFFASLAVMGAMSLAFGWYYKTSQARISILTENTAKLEVAVETAESSITLLQDEAVRTAELQISLQGQLQQAEAYGDNLRRKLRDLDLLSDAIRDAANLEGRMNGATAKLWREIMDETGNDGGGERSLPKWLQLDTGAGSQNSDADGEGNNSDSSTPETN